MRYHLGSLTSQRIYPAGRYRRLRFHSTSPSPAAWDALLSLGAILGTALFVIAYFS